MFNAKPLKLAKKNKKTNTEITEGFQKHFMGIHIHVRQIRFLRLTFLLYDLLLSRLLIYCKAVKQGLQFANILAEILCLQV